MKAISEWTSGYQSKVSNGRGHEFTVDLPTEQGGDDSGATALEVSVMGLAGCISTIFAMIAKKSNLEFSSLKVDIDAAKRSATVEAADIKVYISTDDEEKAQKTLEKTLEACPVGILFEEAGVEISHELIVE